jgi:hypothetical protein
MEVVAITASFFALAGAAHKASKLSHRLYHVARTAGYLKYDVQLLATEVENFAWMVSTTTSMMEDHLERYEGSDILKHLGPKSLDHVASQAKYIFRCIEGIKMPVSPQKRVFKLFLDLWKWHINAPERAEICLWIDRIKSSLSFIMANMCYEALIHKIHNPNITPQRVKELESQM